MQPVNSDRNSQPLLQEAAAFAARAHRHQVRKDGKTPYISHLIRVTLTVSHVFGCNDPVVLAVALLHDTIEDTTTDYDDLAERFGADIADRVAALTKNMALPEKQREEEYDQRIAKGDWRVRLVKLADVYDNFCDVETWPAEKQAKQKREAYDKCLRAVALAKPDTEPAVRAAVEAVRRLVEPYEGPQV
jgi:guanosine-3',5'-bis(diphosphate) 3'-pyrophosphohydrolase